MKAKFEVHNSKYFQTFQRKRWRFTANPNQVGIVHEWLHSSSSRQKSPKNKISYIKLYIQYIQTYIYIYCLQIFYTFFRTEFGLCGLASFMHVTVARSHWNFLRPKGVAWHSRKNKINEWFKELKWVCIHFRVQQVCCPSITTSMYESVSKFPHLYWTVKWMDRV